MKKSLLKGEKAGISGRYRHVTDTTTPGIKKSPATRQAVKSVPPTPGTRFHRRYDIEKKLDEGGMGALFVALDTKTGERVALKVLTDEFARDRMARNRLYREAEIISELDHPHIVEVVDYGANSAGTPFVALELLEGESLDKYLERGGRFDDGQTVRIILQIADALGAVHMRDIVHRDLKPGNVFMTGESLNEVHIKLLDFGIGRQATQSSSSITGEHDIMGTAEYMTPEQASGNTAQVDHRGDQFALGVMMYEMLTGTVPFTGETLGEVLDQIKFADPVAPSAYGATPAFDTIVLKALAKSPGDRYASVQEFAYALAEAANVPMPTFGVRQAPRSPTPDPQAMYPKTMTHDASKREVTTGVRVKAKAADSKAVTGSEK